MYTVPTILYYILSRTTCRSGPGLHHTVVQAILCKQMGTKNTHLVFLLKILISVEIVQYLRLRPFIEKYYKRSNAEKSRKILSPQGSDVADHLKFSRYSTSARALIEQNSTMFLNKHWIHVTYLCRFCH